MGMLRECLHAHVHGSVVHSTQGRGQPRHKINLGLCTMKKKTAINKNFLFCDNLAAPAVLAAVWRTDQQACFKILPFPLSFAAEEVDASNPRIFDSFAVQIGLFWAFACLAEDSTFSVLLNELTPLFSAMWLSKY